MLFRVTAPSLDAACLIFIITCSQESPRGFIRQLEEYCNSTQKREKVVIQLKVSHFVGPAQPDGDHIITRMGSSLQEQY